MSVFQEFMERPFIQRKFIVVHAHFVGRVRIDPNAINAYWAYSSEETIIRLACGAEIKAKISIAAFDSLLDDWFADGYQDG